MKKPIVSVIVPTKNSGGFLDACLSSIRSQTYKNIELIVVDNHSSDNTKKIAKKYTQKVFNKGPERSTQRNYATDKATGDYLLFIDSDMELNSHVVADCIQLINKTSQAVIIPEESFGYGFWARCKALERSFYVGNDDIEAARFFSKDIFYTVGKYNDQMISGEDWDLSRRVQEVTRIVRIKSFIRHNEGHINLLQTLKKKFYYARHSTEYLATNNTGLLNGAGPIKRYLLFFSHSDKLFKSPVLGFGMLFMKTLEYLCGAMGYILSGIKVR